ncbi:conserved hypothetical protein [Theileria orientalis strain Shintoku]|uniref:Uncharacterized protein n=1 Tax=Theileria orientalis strain Shintoku TaxID=869250 RepID=J4D657_THEOR|nr:conserved hypothetical protein [Theileria orientalis strain Shintoku]BAM39355.1 conserved hypothetical protein [Theileria orientalis strain Shintoku]|eukprot:XP_009689656.1 conserved hypothetical protein [Theileria orientalis strain Shintoku]
MNSDDSQPSSEEGEPEKKRRHSEGYTSNQLSGSKTHYQNLKSYTNAKLLHLGKTLLAYNTHESHKYALEIASIFLNGIPPEGYVPEDLFTHFKKEPTEKLFKRFLSITATTTPHLRASVLEHSVRLLAVKDDIAGIADEVTRRCNEWNLEKHELAKHYKWAVKHMDVLTNFNPKNITSDFTVELENVLVTYLERLRLPNKNLIGLYCQIQGKKSLELLNKYIRSFPSIYFLRFNRLKIILSTEEDLIKFVTLSGYSSVSVEFLNCFKHMVSPDKLVLLLFDLVLAIPYLKRNWAILHEVISGESREVSEALESIKRSELVNMFNVHGNIGRRLPQDCVEPYLRVASVLVDPPHLELLRLQLTH